MNDDWGIYEKKDIIDDLYNYKVDSIKNNIMDINFYDIKQKKEEEYKLIKDGNELLLCKENIIKEKIISNDYDKIKIGELFNNEDNEDYYYINKEKLKEKYLHNIFEIDKNINDVKIDNNNKEEMEKLYKEISMKHPRKKENGEIQKYSFFSWTGFLCFKKISCLEKNEFNDLPLGISSYFKTIKLFILFFFIISFINLFGIIYYSQYTSKNKNFTFLQKTTLSNTMITTYNSLLFFNTTPQMYNTFSFYCKNNKKIGKVVSGYKFKNLKNESKYEFSDVDNLIIEIPDDTIASELDNDIINQFNEQIKNSCLYKSECKVIVSFNNDKALDSYFYYLILYECVDTSLFPDSDSTNSLISKVQLITIFTSSLLIILYFYFKYAINIEKKEYYKNKIFINNYTLVLHELNINSIDYYKELNDLIYHLNTRINEIINLKYDNVDQLKEKLNDNNNFANIDNFIFDIIISNVNEKKIQYIEKIKTLQNNVTDIKTNNDSIPKKVKNIYNTSKKTISYSLNDIDDDSLIEEENPPTIKLSKKQEEIIENKKMDIKKQIIKITDEIKELHKESEQKKYVDIYIIFKSPIISNSIFKIYKKNKCKRCCIYFCCQSNKIKKYYYKNQWLNFQLANNSPSNIKWENCYVSTGTKKKKRCISKTISIIIIILAGLIYFYLNKINTNFYIICINLGINIGSSILLLKLTNYEKYSTLTKSISSVIKKYFILNFIISGILININTYFSYLNFDKYHEIINNILSSMLYTSFTSHISVLIAYGWNKFLRYLDSRFENGKKTRIKNRVKYENLYLGADFIMSDRYSKIFVNLFICLMYGTYCPLIYFFFMLFLITTLIVDKFLIINYYKNPPYYDNYLSKLTQSFLFFGIILFFYSTINQLCNPYLFNYYQEQSKFFMDSSHRANFLVNPFTIIFKPFYFFDKNKISYALSGYIIPYIALLYSFIILVILTKLIGKIIKKCSNKSLLNVPRKDIGEIYSNDELKKYYELKKLQLFKFLINSKNNKTKLKDYSYLINNYKLNIDYLKRSIKNKKCINDKFENKNMDKINNDENENLNNIIINENKHERLLLDDASYNLCFIPNYEIYNYFDLLFS